MFLLYLAFGMQIISSLSTMHNGLINLTASIVSMLLEGTVLGYNLVIWILSSEQYFMFLFLVMHIISSLSPVQNSLINTMWFKLFFNE